jgi:transcriptional regulator with XRE-family HTH domain
MLVTPGSVLPVGSGTKPPTPDRSLEGTRDRGIASTSLTLFGAGTVDGVSNADEIREFLTTWRAKVTPDRAGLPRYGRQRRVPGLRREEVALLAGISVEYYTRLERGNARGVSETVLEGISQALQLDEAEHAHLLDLIRTGNAERPTRRTSMSQRVRPIVQRIVDALTGIAAFVHNGRLDMLYANLLAAALYSEHLRDPVQPPTRRDSCSSTRRRGLSTSNGRASPTTSSRRCTARLVGTRTIGRFQTSSGCSRREVRNSAFAGRATMSASTDPASSASITRLWAT